MSELVIDRGVEWPLIAIDYSGIFHLPDKRFINFALASAPTLEDPVHAIRPLPVKGALRVLVPIGVQLCQFFFGSLPITLQDEASIKNGPLLSTLKLLTGKSAYSTYGIYGFYMPEVNQLRLNKAAQFYATYSVSQTFDLLLVQRDADTIKFFDFGYSSEYQPSAAWITVWITQKLEEYRNHKTRFDQFWNLALQAPCGMKAADLDLPITQFCTKLCAAGDSLPDEYELVTVSRYAQIYRRDLTAPKSSGAVATKRSACTM